MWRPRSSLVRCRRITGIAITSSPRAPYRSEDRYAASAVTCASVSSRAGMWALGRCEAGSQPLLEIRERVLRADARQVWPDGRPHRSDGVAAVAAVADEILLALLGGLLRDRRADRHQQQHERQDPPHHCPPPDFVCRTVKTGHGARRIT